MGAPLLRSVQGRVRCCRGISFAVLSSRSLRIGNWFDDSRNYLDLCVRGAHPCKVRKDGAPSVVVIPNESKGGPPAPGLTGYYDLRGKCSTPTPRGYAGGVGWKICHGIPAWGFRRQIWELSPPHLLHQPTMRGSGCGAARQTRRERVNGRESARVGEWRCSDFVTKLTFRLTRLLMGRQCGGSLPSKCVLDSLIVFSWKFT